MKRSYYGLILFLIFVVNSCDSSNSSSQDDTTSSTDTIGGNTIDEEKEVTILSSFVFVGCNRVGRQDKDNTDATNATSANLSVLKRIYADIANLENKPSQFFFLGDLVLGESTLSNLDGQLDAWVKLYNDTKFSKISTSEIELVAVPGNHEMLTYADHDIPGHTEWPLKGATEIWMKYMSPYIPSDCEHISGKDSLNNQMTFSFVRGNVGFVVMNTDTYNKPTKTNPYGLEGIIPTKWIAKKVKEFRADAKIDHIFVLGHKPYYVGGQAETGHAGLPEGLVLWPLLRQSRVIAMLSAHVHDYQRMQPGGEGTYQIIAGNGGSPDGAATFFGYTIINILSDGEVELQSRGFNIGTPYYAAVPENPMTLRDNTILTWAKNANPYGE